MATEIGEMQKNSTTFTVKDGIFVFYIGIFVAYNYLKNVV